MIITRRWLEQHLDLSGISNEQISIAFNSLGFEVEETKDFSKLNTKLVLGKVLESTPMLGTTLRFNKVDVGNEIKEIVCGAANIDKDQYVIIALPGVTIANGLTLTERKIQGKISQGMVCALNEIGFVNNALTEIEQDSIFNFTDDIKICEAQIGKEIEILKDYIWDVDLTLNRSDALGAYQLLKEIGNYFNRSYKCGIEVFTKKLNTIKTKIVIQNEEINKQTNTISLAKIEVKNLETLCLNSEDNLWIKKNGHQASNVELENLATITTIETGQPIILLDADKITNNLSLEYVEQNELELLALTMNNKVVANIGEGVKFDFIVTNATKNILVIFLNFSPPLMRAQQKKLNISNANIQRYTKPLNPNLYDLSYNVLLTWFKKYDILVNQEEILILRNVIRDDLIMKTTIESLENLIGVKLTLEEIQELFMYLEFNVYAESEKIIFEIDPNRVDIYNSNDIGEEVARLYGYDKIEAIPPTLQVKASPKRLSNKLQSKTTNFLIGKGYNNVKTYSLINEIDEKEWNLFQISNPVKLMSPLSKLHEIYRTSLMKSLIDVATYNSSVDNKEVNIFEIADIYNLDGLRYRHLAVLTNQEMGSAAQQFFNLKSICEGIINLYNFKLEDFEFINQEDLSKNIHPFINAKILYKKNVVGFIFKLHPQLEKKKKIKQTYLFELDLDKLYSLANLFIVAQDLSKFQKSTRDLSIEVDANLGYYEVYNHLVEQVPYLVKAELIDVYTNEELISNNKKSLTIQFTFNDQNKQLAENDITNSFDSIIKRVNQNKYKVR